MHRALLLIILLLLAGCDDIYIQKTAGITKIPCLKSTSFQHYQTYLSPTIKSDDHCPYSLKFETSADSSACEANPQAKTTAQSGFVRLVVFRQQQRIYRAQINTLDPTPETAQKLFDKFMDDLVF